MNGFELMAHFASFCGIDFCVCAQKQIERKISPYFSQKGIELIVPISETSASIIADGYARASGKIGLVLCEEEVEKLITGVTSTWADKTPMIIISIVPEASSNYDFAFERKVDFTQIFKTITRWQKRIIQPDELLESLVQAVAEAVSWRGGPVFLEIALKVLEQKINLSEKELSEFEKRIKRAKEPAKSLPSSKLIDQAFELLARAQKPLIFSGGGVVRAGAVKELNQLAEIMQVPITSSMGGMGSALPTNPMYLGPPSYLSGEAFHYAIKNADVILAVGCVFSGLDGFGLPPLWSCSAQFIQVNIDPEHIAFNPPADLALLGNAELVISELLARAKNFKPSPKRKEWAQKLQRLNQEHRQRIINEAKRDWEKIHPAQLVLELKNLLRELDDFYAVLDGGNTCLWAGMLIDLPGERRGFFPTGMGTLGSGLPMAIGVKKAVGESAPVVILSGDGSFLYSLQEFETLLKYQLPIKVVIFNDSAWNMIRAGQVSFVGEVFGTELPSSDYAEVAKSYGCFGAKVKKKEEIAPALQSALSSDLPAVVDVDIDPDTIPDSLISFAMVEFEGAGFGMLDMLKSLLKGKIKLDIRLLNQLKYILKI